MSRPFNAEVEIFLAGNVLAGRYGNVSGLPAHRVTASGGRLSGVRAFAPGEMKQRLRSEGVEVRSR